MLLVLVVLGVQAVCGVHLDDAGHGGTSAYGASGHPAVQASATAPDQVTGAAPGHHGEGHGEDPNHCAEDRPVTARSDRTVSPSIDLARAPALAMQWLVPEITQHCPQEPAGLAVATAPSLHALGISRT